MGALPSSSSSTGAGRTKAAPSRERTLQMARSILDQAHALQIQSMGDLGRIRDLDRTLAGTLMAEFSRVQLIVQEDVGKSLVALRSDLLATCSAFIMDVGRVMDVPPADPRLALLEASLERFRRQASLKFDLPLAEMDAAAVDITAFMNARLQELSSRSELPDLIGEAAMLMDRHNNRVWELVRNPDLGLSDVYSRVLVGLLARQPIEADLFPGILEGLAGNLGLSPAGTVNPPRLTVVVPPNFPLGMDKEFMLTSFHVRACLRRASLTVSGKRRQVAFCPYCGVTNDNAETGLNHVRKHLDVMLVCGGCHTKSVCLGQTLQKHMKDNCPAVLAILGKTRGDRR